MRQLPRLFLLLLLAVEVRIPTAWACSCLPFEPERDLETEDAVYVAKVVKIGGFARCNSVDLEVTEAFKGVEVGDLITRRVRIGDGGSCGLPEIPYEEGEERLFTSVGDEPISTCTTDTPVDEAQEDIETLRTLTEE